MSTKHTPGPWKVKPFENEQGDFNIDSEYGYHIAETIGGLGNEEEANANLIAAAPDLLESLQAMVAMMDSGDEHGAGSPWHIKATAAITKATGEKA